MCKVRIEILYSCLLLELWTLPFDAGFSRDSLVLVDFLAKVDNTFRLYWRQNNRNCLHCCMKY